MSVTRSSSTMSPESDLHGIAIHRRRKAGRWLLLATAVLLLAAVFRLIALDDVPPGLAQDEVLDADIAQFIRGGERALFFRHGYGHEPLYHYVAAPFGALYGDNVLAVRLPSVYLGLLLVAATMRWARRDHGSLAALVAGLGLAVSWWPVIFSRIGIRPILEPLLLVSAAWWWPLRLRRVSRHGLASAAVAGVWLGLAMYSYTAARAVPAIPVGVALLAGLSYFVARVGRRPGATQAGDTRAQVTYALITLGVCLLVYLPLGLTLRAQPELQQRLEQLEGPLVALRAGDAGPVVRSTLATLGVFSFTGDPRWTYSVPDRPLFDPLTAILFYAGLLLAVWRWRRPIYAFLLVWLAVALLPSALSPDAPSTVRLIGALSIVYLLPGIAVAGFMTWLAGHKAANSGWIPVAGVLLLLVLVLNAFQTIRDGFGRWPAELETRLRYQTAVRDIGRHWLSSDRSAPVVAEVYFEPIDGATLRRDTGRNPQARWIQTAGVAGALVWPAGVAAPLLYVPEYAPLDPALVEAGGVPAKPFYRSPDAPSVAVYVLPEMPPVALQPVVADFGAPVVAALHGISEPLPTAAGEALEFFSYWDVRDQLPGDLAIFVHLIDKTGAVVAQHDGLDAAAGTLLPGDRLLQRHVLKLPDELTGDYRIQTGLYRRGDGQRLPTGNGADALVLLACVANGERVVCNLPNT